MTTENTEAVCATLEQFGQPIGAFGQILSQDTSITQANDALQLATTTAPQIVAVHENFSVRDLEEFAFYRRRPKGTMATQQIKAFAAYTEAHHSDGTTVFVDVDHMRATAVLDFGDTTSPGHCDNLASLTLKNTAAYTALLATCGRKVSQRDFAEWLENWAPYITPQANDEQLSMAKALAAVRNVTIESATRSQHQEESLSATRSAFESVQAKSDEQLPTFLQYRCRPAAELQERTYLARISILTSEPKPLFMLHIIALETHQEEAAEEMSGLIREQIPQQIPVLMGSYTKR